MVRYWKGNGTVIIVVRKCKSRGSCGEVIEIEGTIYRDGKIIGRKSHIYKAGKVMEIKTFIYR